MSKWMPGDSAGYVVLILDRFDAGWNETPSGVFANVAAAVKQVGDYEEQQRGAITRDTYAVAKLNLSMISRPDNTST